MSNIQHFCDQPNCTVQTDGRCLEGLKTLADCPHYRQGQSEDISEPEPNVSKDVQEPPHVDLPEGNSLSVETCHDVTYASRARVVVIAGRAKTGKTTLLASIYEAFQDGPFAGYNFAGSRTIPGFEKRCHLSRVSSGRSRADTERSKGKFGDTLLHLRVRAIDNSHPIREILFTDLEGENFRQATNSTEYCQRLHIVRRADHFVLLIDGEKICNADKRHAALADGRMLLKRLLDCGMIGQCSRVDVLITKYDRWRKSENTPQLKEYLHVVRKTLNDLLANRVGYLRFEYIAARPDEDIELDIAYGLDRIFPDWVEKTCNCNNRSVSDIEKEATREYDRYLYRNEQRHTQ